MECFARQRVQVSSTEEARMAKDPVCGMMVDEKTAAGKSDYEGKTYYFCAAICKTKFDADPQKYVSRQQAR
jgi:Cu+-exporting ATPase